MRRLIVGGLAVVLAASLVGGPARGATQPHGYVRVDQLGYLAGERKVAYVLLDRPTKDLAFTVENAAGRQVYSGHVGVSTGSWNASYRAVYPIDISALRVHGRYRITVPGAGATSPWFRVANASDLLKPRVTDAVRFFEAQRDGDDVIASVLDRKPSHLNDRKASVYAWPRYESPDSDAIVGSTLKRIGGPVDVEGGWFDAGDFIKFAHTTAYAVDLMLVSQRDLGNRRGTLDDEARYGLRWLAKTWDPTHDALYFQVGIGSGNTAGTFFGDHDSWRLPQEDDTVKGSANRYVRNRPVFATDARPGHLAPNLAGRISAAFALAAQLDATRHPVRARRELAIAAQIYGRAKTTHVHASDVVTALPHAFYPESAWRDDMELGATELSRAAFALHDPRARLWLAQASHWARSYLAHEAGDDTLNLYDVSGLAHAELARLIHAHKTTAVIHRTRSLVLADLRAQLGRGMAHAKADPFRAGGNADDFDVASHTFGLAATAALYHRVTGSDTYDAFGTSQRDWVLGDNPWGVSLMIGVGTTYPACPQHVVANLSGSLTGHGRVLKGAVVNGPNSADLFSDGLGDFFDTGRTCPVDGVDHYAIFTGHGAQFVDDVRAWQTDEPALDFTASALLAFAEQSVG
ncbi:MAG TPA: glycoside hydrolase family 9 protein [Actinomycetes bacterium]|nr:glycoside hydrolase family 9 protein [Actinomycetes bacterium]